MIRLVIGLSVLLFLNGVLAEENVSVLGYLEPYRQIEMNFSEVGVIDEIFVSEGQTVSEEEPLVALNRSVLQAQLAIAQIQANSDSAIKVAEADLEVTQTKFEKLTKLRSSGTAYAAEVARAEADFKKAQAQVSIANEEKEIAKFRVEEIEAQLERRILRSPIDGVVLEINREIAESVSEPSSGTQRKALVKVAKIDQLKLVIHVPADHAGSLEVGKKLPIRILQESSLSRNRESSGFDAVGTVEFVSPAIDPSSETLRTRLVVENPEAKLLSGSHALVMVEGSPEG